MKNNRCFNIFCKFIISATGGIMNIDDALTTRVVFHPRPEESGYVSKGIPTETESGDAVIGGYLHLHRESDALIVFFHGNGEIAADYDELAPVYVGSGASLWVLDYRGYGRSTGFPSYSRMFSDAESVAKDIPRIAELANRSFRQVFVMGRSLGSAPAIFLAAGHSHRFDGLLLDSPFSDGLRLIARLGGPNLKETEMCGVVNNIDRMVSCRIPTLIIHGTDDWIIPVSDADELLSACKSEQKKLVKIRGAGHNDLLFRGFATYCKEIREFIVDTTEKNSRTSNPADVFSDVAAHRLSADIISFCSENKKDIRQTALEGLYLKSAKNILDLGCAFGFFTGALKGKVHPEARVTGIDRCKQCEEAFMQSCREAEIKGSFSSSGISLIRQIEENSVDLVLSSYSLYFFPEVISEISRVLKDNGTFIAITHVKPHMKELTDRIKTALQQHDIAFRTDLPLEKIIERFSSENGCQLLSPWFGNIESREYKNSLRFTPETFSDFTKYLRFKNSFFIPDISVPKETLLSLVENFIKEEIIAMEKLVISKNDIIFICSEPLYRSRRKR